MTTYIFVYEDNNIRYFHIECYSKNDNVSVSECHFEKVARATKIVRFYNNKFVETMKSREWTDNRFIEEGVESMDDYIKKYNLRCCYFDGTKFLFKGTITDSNVSLFLEIKSLFEEIAYHVK